MLADRGAVLIAEDDPPTRALLIRDVQALGFRAVGAEHGSDALALLRNTSDVVLVLTDLWMPVMDGRALIAEMKRDPRLAGIPIVQISGTVEEADPQFPALQKPVTKVEVDALVRAYARRG